MYGKNYLSNDFNRILLSLVVIQELDTTKRKIRSIRGFLLYTLEIIQDEKLITAIKTNFQPLFWRRVKNVIKQNKKNSLVEFLFGFSNSINVSSDPESRQLGKKIQKIQSKISLLQQKQIEILSKCEEEQVEILSKVISERSDGSFV